MKLYVSILGLNVRWMSLHCGKRTIANGQSNVLKHCINWTPIKRGAGYAGVM